MSTTNRMALKIVFVLLIFYVLIYAYMHRKLSVLNLIGELWWIGGITLAIALNVWPLKKKEEKK